ncbi:MULTISPECIES: site-specific integrase [unclassified Paraburkholderia]|uniref:tyrosine-type recombinase/integrase n=1 Tax=unclassified Paraburkholderia TaxID=2615204 RepID=UPI000EAC7521|nr:MULTISPECIES: site-specific integrase [unclassified Paraburkholderia]RKR46132.1 integrase [Paraburkholderia sp. BL17N1]TDY26129.1 integrase [Paraburkholderia sp. BL6665CI2N2]
MRSIHRLTAVAVRTITKPGYHPDGAGLHLQVARGGSRSWIYRYQLRGRSCEMGLGGYPTVSLSEAREKAAEARRLKAAGIDPLGQKQHARKTAQRAQERRLSFREAAAKYIELREAGWSPTNAEQWRSTIRLYADQPIGRLDVSEIETGDILRVLEPIWLTRNPTAVQLRTRLEAILAWATSGGHRAGENPARWDNHLQNLLPKVLAKAGHRAALPWQAMPAFMKKLRSNSGPVAKAMAFIVLTGARSAEATGATWREVDLAAKVWNIPETRMKAGRAHSVPLSDAACDLLRRLPGSHRPDDRLFDSVKGKEITGTVLRDLLRDLGYAREELTVHGARSSLRTWLTESAGASERVAESVLAHDSRGDVQKAYERTRHFEARIPLMQQWAEFLDAPFAQPATVLPLEQAA